MCCPGGVVQLGGELSWYAKVEGSVPSEGTCKKQPMNA